MGVGAVLNGLSNGIRQPRRAGRAPSDTGVVGLGNDAALVWTTRYGASLSTRGCVCRRLGAYRTVVPFGGHHTHRRETLGDRREEEDGLETQPGLVHVLRMLVARGWQRHRQSTSWHGTTAIAEESTHIHENGLPIYIEEGKKGESCTNEDVCLPNIMPFLRPVGIMELNHLRAMSVLCTLTYGMEYKVTQESMKRLGLEFVTSSHVYDFGMKRDKLRSQHVVEALEYGDGMSASVLPRVVQEHQQESNVNTVERAVKDEQRSFDGMRTAGAGISWPEFGSDQCTVPASSKYKVYMSPDGHSSRDYIMRETSHVTPKVLEYSDADLPVPEDIAQKRKNNITSFKKMGESSPAEIRESHDSSCPTHWYVADDVKHQIRYFVIQGSDNMDHWRLNLTFDPVQFESPHLGMKAHRGVYEAACKLYDIFLPLVQDYIQMHPHGTIAFTGHSLGGSLGTMLMLMFFHRGVLQSSNLAPVHTFGSPAVFCGGESCSGNCSINGEEGNGVLDKLGLPHDAIRNVIMHKDIVPRAFACDYSLLADFLKHIHESFREHHCLHAKRSVMFNTIGQTLIVQPDESASFVRGEGYHPLLPEGPQLVALKHSKSADHLVTNNAGTPEESTSSAEVSSVEEAYWELMNFPHPLKILRNRGAYGDLGSISRYHNPDNYTKALRGVLKSRGSKAHTILERVGQGTLAYRPSIDKERRNDIFEPDSIDINNNS